MNAEEIRKWVKEVGTQIPFAGSGVIASAEHYDNFNVGILQAQATLEVAAQLAELKEIMRETSSHVEAVTKNL